MNSNPIITKIEKDYSGAFFFYQYVYLREGQVIQRGNGCYGSGSDEMVIDLVSKETGRPAIIDFEVRYDLAGFMAHRSGDMTLVSYLRDEWRPHFPGRITHIEHDVVNDADIKTGVVDFVYDQVYRKMNSGKVRQSDGKAAGESPVKILNHEVQWFDSPDEIFARSQPRYMVDL